MLPTHITESTEVVVTHFTDVATRLNSEWLLLKHPFYQDWMAGTLSKETLQDYACQYYKHVNAFPRFLSRMHSISENESTRRILIENLADEEGITYGTSHPELWIRFAEGLGVQRETVLAAAARPGIQTVVSTFTRLANSSLAEGLGALYAYESQIPEIAESKIEGLKNHYDVSDQSTLEFFEVHRIADIHHREALANVIESLTEEEKLKALQASREAAMALWNFLSDVHRPLKATA